MTRFIELPSKDSNFKNGKVIINLAKVSFIAAGEGDRTFISFEAQYGLRVDLPYEKVLSEIANLGNNSDDVKIESW